MPVQPLHSAVIPTVDGINVTDVICHKMNVQEHISVDIILSFQSINQI